MDAAGEAQFQGDGGDAAVHFCLQARSLPPYSLVGTIKTLQLRLAVLTVEMRLMWALIGSKFGSRMTAPYDLHGEGMQLEHSCDYSRQ